MSINDNRPKKINKTVTVVCLIKHKIFYQFHKKLLSFLLNTKFYIIFTILKQANHEKNYAHYYCFCQSLYLDKVKQVVGVVNDDSGSPLPGATIQIKGSESLGAISDFDGKFSILLKNDENTIIVSYVGFLTEQVEIGDNLSVVINLEPDVTELEEAIVVGYGTVLKSDLTGAVSSVEVDENLSKQLTSIDQLLQGRASGVQITQNAANPNSGVSVKLEAQTV